MNDNLIKYKDKHKGCRVFIVGNGPSLNKTNLDLIKDEFSIGMNRISLLFNKTKWKPTYYVFCSSNAVNPQWGIEWCNSIRNGIKESSKSFIWSKYRKPIENDNDLGDKIEWVSNMTEKGTATPGSFSKDISEYLDKSGTTMNVALQIAAYMGFKEIIIIGADVSWVSSNGAGDDPNHFDKSYKAHIANGERDRAETRMTHDYAYKRMRELGIKVYNATIDTFLDVYPLITYETVTGGKQLNVENIIKHWKPYGHIMDEDTREIQDKRKIITDYWNKNKYINNFKKK